MAMKIKRRDFLITSAVAGIGTAIFSYPHFIHLKKSAQLGRIIGGGKGVMNNKPIHYLSMVDLDEATPSPLFFPLDFLAHGTSIHPFKPHLLALFEKKGPGACELDFNAGHVTRTIVTDPKRIFYGHGSYSADGRHLYSTETILETEDGVIVARDSQTMKIEGFFPTYGSNPHDCQLIENGTVLAITNGGSRVGSKSTPCVTYVEIDSQKLLQKYQMADPRFNTGHLIVSHGKDLAVASAPRLGLPEDGPGALSILGKDGQLKNLNTSKYNVNLKSETLSLCIDEIRGTIAATSPAGNLVTFWNLHSGDLISKLELPNPRGIVMTADHSCYAISSGQDAELVLVSAETRTPVGTHIPRAGYSGSHLYLLT
jgi:uncharacterized protein